MRRTILATVIALGLFATAVVVAGQGPAGEADRLTPELLKAIELRSIGPALATGRIADIAIDPKNTNVWYVASAFGGLWKTVNRGITFTPVLDDYSKLVGEQVTPIGPPQTFLVVPIEQ
jgi:hypothetical protein